MKVLDLFSGIGGFSYGLERLCGGFRTVAFCEIDPFCRQVLRKHWPEVPIHEDIRKLTGEQVGPVDVICGGYPCQPFSVAGKRGGAADDRHLWPEMFRLVQEVRPAWVIGENVAGHISMGLDSVLSDLEGIGYTARTFVIPACAVDAQHRRDRVWVVAHADLKGLEEREGITGHDGEERQAVERSCRWQPESGLDRVAHGVSRRMDRLRVLGNAVVPQVVEQIGRAILTANAEMGGEIWPVK